MNHILKSQAEKLMIVGRENRIAELKLEVYTNIEDNANDGYPCTTIQGVLCCRLKTFGVYDSLIAELRSYGYRIVLDTSTSAFEIFWSDVR